MKQHILEDASKTPDCKDRIVRVSAVFNPWLKKPSPPTRPTRAALAKNIRAAAPRPVA